MPNFDVFSFIMVLRPLRNPDDLDQVILVPCVEAIVTRDPKDNAQIRIIRLRNNRGAVNPGRGYHVRRVKQKIGTPTSYTEDDSIFVDVERIDGLAMHDPKTFGHIFARRFLNTDEDDTYPAKPELLQEIRDVAGDRGFRNVVRITADNKPDGEPWVDIELTFMSVVVDPKTNGQIYAYCFLWPPLGDRVDDPSDPYLPHFLEINLSMETVDDGEGMTDPVPFRLDPLQNIVNISWGGVAEFETDEQDPHTPSTDNSAIALMRQAATAISDFNKFTYSVWFNFPSDATASLTNSFMYKMMEFGGDPVSFIGVGNPAVESSDGEFIVSLKFTGPSVVIPWGSGGVPLTYYGSSYPNLSADINHDSDAEDLIFSTIVTGKIRLKDVDPAWETSLETFFDKWHHLAISLDTSEAEMDTEPVVLYGWEWEATGGYTEDLGTYQGTIGWSPRLAEFGVVGSAIAHDATISLDLRPGDFSNEEFPDANDHPNERMIVYYYDLTNLYGNLSPVTASTFTSFPSRTVSIDSDPFPMHMVLDGKNKMFDTGVGQNLGIFELDQQTEEASEDNRFPLEEDELAVPIQSTNTDRGNIRLRLSKLQVWFDTYVDMTVANNLAKFIVVTKMPEPPLGTTPPPGSPPPGSNVGNPAKLTKEERETAINNGVPLTRLMSPAAFAFVQPHMYHDGGAAIQDPQTLDWGGFAKNLGKGGKFTVLHDIESYSPAPKNIPIPNT